MANADKVIVTREVITEVEEEVVQLEMTVPEARALFAVLMRVGGRAAHSPRGVLDPVRIALRGAFLPPNTDPDFLNAFADPEHSLASGSVMFEDYPKGEDPRVET